MKKINIKKILTLIIVAIVVISAAIVAVFIGSQYLEDEEEVKNPLNVKVFADKTEGTLPLSINFSSIVTDSQGKIIYNWDFGNGNTSNKREPTVVYRINGTYVCNLTVTDDRGQKVSDKIIIQTQENKVPDVTIVLSSLNPARPYLPGTLKMWSKMADSFQGASLRRGINFIKKTNLFTGLLDLEGFVDCKAVVIDQEGDDPVYYKWILEPVPYGLFSKPVNYTFEGKDLEILNIPLLYIYGPSNQFFDLTCKVTDSSGNIGEDSIKFNVKKSSFENSVGGAKQIVTLLRNTLWVPIIAPSLPKSMKEDFVDSLWDIAGKIPVPVLEMYVKIKLFSTLLQWNLLSLSDISGTIVLLADSMTSLIEKYPNSVKPIMENMLEKAEDVLEKLNITFLNDILLPAFQDIKEMWGISNYLPDIKNPNPADGDKIYNINYPNVTISVYDFDASPGEWINVTISGKYVQNQTWNYTWADNESEATFSADLNTLPANQRIQWTVKVIDFKGRPVEETFSFKT